MKPSLRESLAASHVSTIAIAVLLVWSLESGLSALWILISPVISFLGTAIAIFDVPYISFTKAARLALITGLFFLFGAIVSLVSAWLLAWWVHGAGPLRVLSTYRSTLIRRNHV